MGEETLGGIVGDSRYAFQNDLEAEKNTKETIRKNK